MPQARACGESEAKVLNSREIHPLLEGWEGGSKAGSPCAGPDSRPHSFSQDAEDYARPVPGLIQGVLDAYVSHMKTVSAREFFHWPSTVKTLHPGQSLAVTDNGVPSFIVTKAGKRPRRALAELEREAREICPHPRKHKVNFTKAIRDLKGR